MADSDFARVAANAVLYARSGGDVVARPARGMEVLHKAKELLLKAKSVSELRQAQAVILPLEFGFSLSQTANILGISKVWACRLRSEFIRTGGETSRPSQSPSP
jgi:hypothetical protein